MSQANVELARRALGAFNQHDIEACIACLDPSVEYHSAITVPGGAVYHGHDGVRKYFGDFKDAWETSFASSPRRSLTLASRRSCSISSTDADNRAARRSRCQGHRCVGGATV